MFNTIANNNKIQKNKLLIKELKEQKKFFKSIKKQFNNLDKKYNHLLIFNTYYFINIINNNNITTNNKNINIIRNILHNQSLLKTKLKTLCSLLDQISIIFNKSLSLDSSILETFYENETFNCLIHDINKKEKNILLQNISYIILEPNYDFINKIPNLVKNINLLIIDIYNKFKEIHSLILKNTEEVDIHFKKNISVIFYSQYKLYNIFLTISPIIVNNFKLNNNNDRKIVQNSISFINRLSQSTKQKCKNTARSNNIIILNNNKK